eukprot:3719425-Amphidinium_carterae.1
MCSGCGGSDPFVIVALAKLTRKSECGCMEKNSKKKKRYCHVYPGLYTCNGNDYNFNSQNL